ncbi:MAG: PQQ-binding-like beta-propeller repeat protein [Acidobacteria bacterium]|nr:PQQ-binding-like beta-propeller repeat protein [Acidobacteriota bacterium]
MRRLLFVFLFSCLLIATSFAQTDWTRFRGPNGNGVSTATNLPIEFGPEKNVVWKAALPAGHASPVFTKDKIFVTAHTPTAKDKKDVYQLFVICLDRATGKQLWQREVPRVNKGRLENVNGPASASPVTDGTNVYVFFQDFGLLAYDLNGKEKWRLPLAPMNIYYGYGASPMLVDDKLILPVDADGGEAYLLAVNKKSGKVLWKTPRPEIISGYSTPTVWQPKQGAKQLIIPESFQLSAYSVADGKRVWWVRGLACESKSVASIKDDTLYVNGWGFPQNQPGQQIATVPFAEGLTKYDANKDGLIALDEVKNIDRNSNDKMGFMLKAAFDAFDANKDDKLNANDWNVFRSMMASENGLLAIRLPTMGGQGDMTVSAVQWKYQRPVPQVPSTLLYQNTLFMVNDSGILISFDPATGKVIKQGRLKGAIDKYFASPVGADGKVFLVSQDGTMSIVSAQGEWEVLQVNTLGEEVFATPAPLDGKLYVRTQKTLYCFGK